MKLCGQEHQQNPVIEVITLLSMYYRCHHRTTHAPSYNPMESLTKDPLKRLKNIDCPFFMSFKILKVPVNDKTCNILLQWNHNHPVKSLHVMSFKDIPAHVREEITGMYHRLYTPGLPYREFVKAIQSRSKDDLEFHKFLAGFPTKQSRTVIVGI